MSSSSDAARVVVDAWRQATRDNQDAHPLGAISASQLHDCPRSLYYRATAAPATDTVPERLNIPAHLGTAIHDFYLPRLAQAWNARDDVADAEVEPELGIEIDRVRLLAHPDLVITYTDGTASIFELKTTGKAGVDAALAGEPKNAHLDQCRMACALLEHTTGTPIRGYWIYYLDRADPERHWALVSRSWSDAEIERGYAMIDTAAATGAYEANAPRWFAAAVSDAYAPHSPCPSCPWQSRCLGKDQADPQRSEAADELVDALDAAREHIDDAEAELAEFVTRTLKIDRYRKGKSYLSDLVEHLGLEPGDYHIRGNVKTLVWREGHDRTDGAACAKILQDLGHTVPKSRTSGYYQLK